MSDEESNQEQSKLPTAATATSAANTTTNKNESVTLAQAIYAVETLVQVFGFPVEAANQAVNEVGVEINQCCNYILEQGLGMDTGGAVYPIDNCPHVTTRVQVSPGTFETTNQPVLDWPCQYNHRHAKRGNLKGETLDDGSCPKGENWICLQCGQVFCSRYVNGHGLQHWKDTQQLEERKGMTDRVGHCIAVSLADLSVWCHQCSAYLMHDETKLKPIIARLEQLKFPPFQETNQS